MLLAKTYDPKKHDPTNWWVSEKLDGVRAFWNPTRRQLYSRNGNIYNAPKFFLKDAPDCALDGEIWYGRNAFEKTGTVRKSEPNEEEWSALTYMIFDAPEHSGTYEERVAFLQALDLPKHFKILPSVKCTSRKHLDELLAEYEASGAEGLMLRQPGSRYEKKRSNTLLKVKSFEDDEATVIEHLQGNGRLDELTGAVRVRDKDGHVFKIGTGFTDKQRSESEIPPIGSIVTYKYFEKTKNGVPRFPVFLRVRHDAENVQEQEEKKEVKKEKEVQKEVQEEKIVKKAPKKSSKKKEIEVIDLTDD
jgi:DNA ligase-1